MTPQGHTKLALTGSLTKTGMLSSTSVMLITRRREASCGGLPRSCATTTTVYCARVSRSSSVRVLITPVVGSDDKTHGITKSMLFKMSGMILMINSSSKELELPFQNSLDQTYSLLQHTRCTFFIFFKI